jgi:hypothetical protein
MLALPRGQLRWVWAQGGTLDKASGPQPVPPLCRRRARDPVYGPLQPLAEYVRVVEPSGDRRQGPRHGMCGADARTGLGLSRAPEAILTGCLCLNVGWLEFGRGP